MKRLITLIASAALLAGTGAAIAQPGHDDHNNNNNTQQHHDDNDHNNGPSMSARPGMTMSTHGPSHADWKKGGHIGHDDWGRGSHIDYRQHHLKAPPRGYEWRQVDNNYVLAAVATGLIASVILASH